MGKKHPPGVNADEGEAVHAFVRFEDFFRQFFQDAFDVLGIQRHMNLPHGIIPFLMVSNRRKRTFAVFEKTGRIKA